MCTIFTFALFSFVLWALGAWGLNKPKFGEIYRGLLDNKSRL